MDSAAYAREYARIRALTPAESMNPPLVTYEPDIHGSFNLKQRYLAYGISFRHSAV